MMNIHYPIRREETEIPGIYIVYFGDGPFQWTIDYSIDGLSCETVSVEYP